MERCLREGKDPGTKPTKPSAAALNARAAARRNRARARIAEDDCVTIPDTVYDAAGNPTIKYCSECGAAAAPAWRRCREDQCRAGLTPRSKLAKRGAFDKSRRQRDDQPGVWDRRDQRLIRRARREAAEETTDESDYDYTDGLGDDPRPNAAHIPEGWYSDEDYIDEPPSEDWDSELNDDLLDLEGGEEGT